jgi:hypothetical protein
MTVFLLFALAKLHSDCSSSALTGNSLSLSPPEGEDPSSCKCWVPATAWLPAYMGGLLPYQLALVVQAKCSRPTQMLAHYSNVHIMNNYIYVHLMHTGQSSTQLTLLSQRKLALTTRNTLFAL